MVIRLRVRTQPLVAAVVVLSVLAGVGLIGVDAAGAQTSMEPQYTREGAGYALNRSQRTQRFAVDAVRMQGTPLPDQETDRFTRDAIRQAKSRMGDLDPVERAVVAPFNAGSRGRGRSAASFRPPPNFEPLASSPEPGSSPLQPRSPRGSWPGRC